MQIVSALFMENFEIRQAADGAARLDITGAMFSMAAPQPAPLTVSPHLVSLIYCPPTVAGQGVFEVIFTDSLNDPETVDEPLARNVSPFTVEPGKFTYRLVKGEIEFSDYGQVFAHCRVGKGDWHVVPFTVLPPVA